MNVEEGWYRDVSDVMADKVSEVAQREDMELTDGTLAFLEAHEPEVKQATTVVVNGGAKPAIPAKGSFDGLLSQSVAVAEATRCAEERWPSTGKPLP
jgi:hypothetical protein